MSLCSILCLLINVIFNVKCNSDSIINIVNVKIRLCLPKANKYIGNFIFLVLGKIRGLRKVCRGCFVSWIKRVVVRRLDVIIDKVI